MAGAMQRCNRLLLCAEHLHLLTANKCAAAAPAADVACRRRRCCTHPHLCHVSRLPPRAAALVHQHVEEGLVAAVGQQVDAHQLAPRVWGQAAGWVGRVVCGKWGVECTGQGGLQGAGAARTAAGTAQKATRQGLPCEMLTKQKHDIPIMTPYCSPHRVVSHDHPTVVVSAVPEMGREQRERGIRMLFHTSS